MKKRIALLTAAALASGVLMTNVFAAAEEVAGEWYADMYGMVMTLTLNEDGTYAMDIMGEIEEGTWDLEGETLTMDKGTEVEMTLAYDGETLYAADEEMEMTFGREPIEVFVPAEPNAEAVLEDYAGEWGANNVYAFGMTVPLEMMEMEGFYLTIEDTKVDFMLKGGFMFGEAETELEAEYAEGALTFTLPAANEYSEDTVYTAQLLVDGTLSVSTMMMEDELIFYMEPVTEETAEEAVEEVVEEEAAE